tara:strand:- start:423 stop:1160 length:738 start_codon:yes stop_codon:yes gene_type:complete
VVETTGNTVITFQTGHSGGTVFPIEGYVAGMPLTTPEGDTVTFGSPFVLKTMIELVSISGDHSDQGGTHATQPTISMGICMNASDFDADDNRHLGSGLRISSNSASSEAVEEDLRMTTDSLQTDGSGKITAAGNAYSGSNNPKLSISEFEVGPDMATETANAIVTHQQFMASGDNYLVPNQAMGIASTNANQGFNDAATTVTLYTAIQDMETDAFSGNTACVLTVRFWYMVEADFHNLWGGSGAA